ncbi:MAG: hypothetical protein GTO14_05775 [Anaerolineales bacterium]|nr:hypothetical protein [Anaerolineales bacterium]
MKRIKWVIHDDGTVTIKVQRHPDELEKVVASRANKQAALTGLKAELDRIEAEELGPFRR